MQTLTHSAADFAAECIETGPVFLAAKPADASSGPADFARWFAEHEERGLERVSVRDDGEVNVSVAIVRAARAVGARAIVVGTGSHHPLGRMVYGERALEIIRAADRPVIVVPPVARRWPLRHALVAVDFSAASLRAARACVPMLSRRARITLLHTTDVPVTMPLPQPWSPVNQTRLAERFARFCGMLELPASMTCVSVVTHGLPATDALGWATRRGVDLIACGRRSCSFPERLLTGSTSTAIVRGATCAVLVAPERPGDRTSAIEARLDLTDVA